MSRQAEQHTKTKPRYIAVDTVKDGTFARRRGCDDHDTKSREIVGNDVSCVQGTPRLAQRRV
jgi:hypothetical protein